MTLGELIVALEDRVKGQQEWLLEQNPQIFEEQKHCEEGTVERIYWHYGCRVALLDVLCKLKTLDKPS